MNDAVDMQQDALTTVREFFTALESKEVDRALELVASDIVWRNTSLPTIRGIGSLRRILGSMPRLRVGFRAVVHHIAVEDDVVLTQRTDYLTFGRIDIGFWVCGTFQVRGGRILLWHDHFSWGNLLRGTVVGVVEAVLPG